MLDTIRDAWGWTGLTPAEVVATNPFGNLIVRAADDSFWRICPEEWLCVKVASNPQEYATLSGDDDFRTDWEMVNLVELAERELGPLPEGRCYCLKVPAVIGGSYEAANFGTITLKELISFAGEMAQQTRDV